MRAWVPLLLAVVVLVCVVGGLWAVSGVAQEHNRINSCAVEKLNAGMSEEDAAVMCR